MWSYLVDREQHSDDTGIFDLFLKKGDELCGAYSSSPISRSPNVQSGRCEGAFVFLFFSPEISGPLQSSDWEAMVFQRETAAQLGDREHLKSFVNGVYQQ